MVVAVMMATFNQIDSHSLLLEFMERIVNAQTHVKMMF